MAMKQFTLVEKNTLTADVFELHFECSENFEIQAWQFVTFILPKIWGRAYSILSQNWNKTVLLIKRVDEDNDWRGWSMMICDINIWETLNWVWPAGHFVLTPEGNNKLFIWTGTGLVPLYNQIIIGLWRWDNSQYTLVFWVRTNVDLFYLEEFKKIAEQYSNFKYNLYLSREEFEWTTKWYVTDFITTKNSKIFNEFYICWAPAMVDWVVERLEENWILEDNIFTEKY